jgi:hypothetical protein
VRDAPYAVQKIVQVQLQKIPFHQPKPVALERRFEVAFFGAPGIVACKGVHANDLAPVGEQPANQVRPDKTRRPGYQHPAHAPALIQLTIHPPIT